MSDRTMILTVVLERPTRVDDAEATMNAIKQLRGVLSVEANVHDQVQFMAQEIARRELGEKLMEVLYPRLNDGGGR